MNLLVVSGDKNVFDIIQGSGYVSVRASSASAALEILEDYRPELLILDDEIIGGEKLKKIATKKKILILTIGVELTHSFDEEELKQQINQLLNPSLIEKENNSDERETSLEEEIVEKELIDEMLVEPSEEILEETNQYKKEDLNRKIDELLKIFNREKDNSEVVNTLEIQSLPISETKVLIADETASEQSLIEDNVVTKSIIEENIDQKKLFSQDKTDESYNTDSFLAATFNEDVLNKAEEIEAGLAEEDFLFEEDLLTIADNQKVSKNGSIFGKVNGKKIFAKKTETFYIPHQEVISIASVKGGTGKTSLAIALTKATQSVPTVIIDMNFANGGSDLSSYLDLPQLPHWGYFLRNKTKEGLKEAVIHQESFDVLQVPPKNTLIEGITKEDIAKLIDLAKRLYSVILIDLPLRIDPIYLEAIDLSTVTVIVSDGQMSEVNRIREFKDICERPILVLNKGRKMKKVPKQFIPEEVVNLDFNENMIKLIETGNILAKNQTIINNALRVAEQVFPKVSG